MLLLKFFSPTSLDFAFPTPTPTGRARIITAVVIARPSLTEKILPSPTLHRSTNLTFTASTHPFVSPTFPQHFPYHPQAPVECLHGRPITYRLHRLGHRHETTRFLNEQQDPRSIHGCTMAKVTVKGLQSRREDLELQNTTVWTNRLLQLHFRCTHHRPMKRRFCLL